MTLSTASSSSTIRKAKAPAALPKAILSKLRSISLEEKVGSCYARYTATQIESSTEVWVFHFSNVDESIRDSIEGRIQKISKIEHTGLTTPIYHINHEEDVILVSEAIDGTRLDYLLDDVSPMVAEYWSNYLSDILLSLHKAEEVHGLLAPQLIYKTADGMKIIGAGFSDLWEPVAKQWSAECSMSTGSFLAPEVRLDGIDKATQTSDIYSLGAILYSAYTHHSSGTICVMPSTKVDVPHHIDVAVMSAIHIDPSYRQQTIREFIDAFYGSLDQHLPDPEELSFDHEVPVSEPTIRKPVSKWEAGLFKVACTLLAAFFVVMLFVWIINLTTGFGERKINEIHNSIKADILQARKSQESGLLVSRWSEISLRSQTDHSMQSVQNFNEDSEERIADDLSTPTPGSVQDEAQDTRHKPARKKPAAANSLSQDSPSAFSPWRDLTMGYFVTN